MTWKFVSAIAVWKTTLLSFTLKKPVYISIAGIRAWFLFISAFTKGDGKDWIWSTVYILYGDDLLSEHELVNKKL